MVAALDGCESVAVTVALPPFSGMPSGVVLPPFPGMLAGVAVSVAVGASSSSAIFSATADGWAIPCGPDAVPVTVTRLSGASVTLSIAVILTTPALVVAPAAKVSTAPLCV